MTNPKEKLTQQEKDSPRRLQFYKDVLGNLEQHHFPYGIIGGHGQAFYSGGRQHTADLDIAVPEQQVGHTLRLLETPGRRIEHKHPDWLNQVWTDSNNAEEISIDLIHGHSTGLIKVQPWWIERGITGKYLGAEHHFAAPEAFVLTKTLLWARRAHDMIDAVQVAYGSNKFRQFDWQLLIDNLGPDRADWRLAYSLAVLEEVLYGKESEKVLPQNVKKQLHNWLTENPIPSPVRGNYFAYDADPAAGSGNQEAWKSGAVAISLPPEAAVNSVLEDVQNWHIWNDTGSRIVQAARKIIGQKGNFDWDALVEKLGDNWRLALYALISTEVLFGETGSNLIPQETRKALSARFVQEEPGKEQGTTYFPDRNWHKLPKRPSTRRN